jgi:host factor-I protein
MIFSALYSSRVGIRPLWRVSSGSRGAIQKAPQKERFNRRRFDAPGLDKRRSPAHAGKKKTGSTYAMAERSQNLQDLFLNTVRKQKISLTIFLINGVKLTGVVTSFDNFCVLLRRDGHSQLVYKHAISTIMPSQPVQMFEGEDVSGS